MINELEDSYVSEITNVVEYNNLSDIEQETLAIINDISSDGYNPNDIYEIEHAFSASSFVSLEKFVIDVACTFKDSVDISDAEELKEDNGETIFCCNVYTSHNLDKAQLMEEIKTFVNLCNKYNIVYDGWGTNVGDK
ncbi:MAG: ribonuclease E inhibitor RraB [Succinivibrionaceae bacterium]